MTFGFCVKIDFMKKNIIFLIPIFLFFIMCQNSKKNIETVQIFLPDTIPMQYSPGYPNFCLPILDGIVNDSLHFKVFFDTGTAGNHFSISDSLKNLFVGDSARVQIGKLKKQMRIEFYGSNRRSFINTFGKNTIMIGWEFFENQIIEFDFENQHILVYNELPDVSAYSKTKITLKNNHIVIPAQVVLQGKTIQDTFNIDTGCNSYMLLSTKHIEKQGIDTTNARYGKGTVSGGVRSSFAIPVDTFKIGDVYATNQNMMITFVNHNAGGLLCTKTLENFSVILDLINYDLYLKPIEKE
jgi:predicted aspartyl protease